MRQGAIGSLPRGALKRKERNYMKRFSAWILTLCMIFASAGVTLAAVPGDEVIVGRDNFQKISGSWHTSENASGIHYQNKGIYCTGADKSSGKITYSLDAAGSYELFWFYSGVKADSGVCELLIPTADGDKTAKFTVNTSTGWKSIGRYNLEAGEGAVTLTCTEQSRFSGLKFVYKGKNIDISSKVYTVDNSAMCISGIAYGTTADELLNNIICREMQNADVYDVSGTVKIGIVEDGDRLRIEADGETFEFYLKTYIDGVSYSDDFNYKDYEEYMSIQTAVNKSENKNAYSAEDVVTSEITEYNGEKVLSMAPNKSKKQGTQYYRFNLIGFDDISDKVIVEYDVMQRNLDGRGLWVYVVGDYTNGDQSLIDKYALWGSNLAARGTLMRDPAHAARWISFEGKQLIMESGRVYHVRQIIDFDGDIETYINGVKAAVTDENLTTEKSKSMKGFGGIKGLGLGVYLEASGDWSGTDGNFAVMWDKVKVYEPAKYAAHFINLLPQKDETPKEDIAERIAKARSVVEEMKEYGIGEDEISNMDLLEYWEDQTASVKIDSEYFDVDNDKHTVGGILKNMTVSEFLEKMSITKGYSAEVVGKSTDDIVVSGDILRVENLFSNKADFTLTANRDIIVLNYAFADDIISNVPYAEKVDGFLKNIVTAKAAKAEIYTGSELNTDTVKNGDILRITVNNEQKDYEISVIPASGENYITDAGEYTVSGNVISGIPYNTTFQHFKGQIKVSDFASISYPYKEDYTGYVADGDEITVTAQNGDERIYTLEVLSGRNTAELSGKAKITVDSVNHVISGVTAGMSVEDLKNALSASNGATFAIYSENAEPLTSGTIKGNETVRVFFEYPDPGHEFDIYTLSCDAELVKEGDIIVTVEGDGFTYTGEKNVSGPAVEPGYNGITTVYIDKGNGIFTPNIEKAGEYDVYIYTSYHSSNKPYIATVYYDGGSEDAEVKQNEPTGWKKIGTYKFAAGDSGYVECKNVDGGGFARLSAVKFENTGSYKLISEVSAVSEDSSAELHEGVNSGAVGENTKIKINSDTTLTKGDIKIISEYGNAMDIEIAEENGYFVISPKYNLRKEVTYYLTVSSDKLSKAYTYVLEGARDAVEATAQITLGESDGSAKIIMELKNNSTEDKEVKILICAYSDAFNMESCKKEKVTVNAGEKAKLASRINTSAKNVRVFIWDGELNPVTRVYYR